MKRNQNSLFSTKRLVLMAALVAIYIVLMGFLSLKISDTLRISFEAVPLALAGMWLGPLGGMLVALVSDFLGAILFYGSWFPLITLGPVLFAAMCGWGVKYIFRSDLSETKQLWKAVVLLILAGIINAFVIGPFTTTAYSIIVMGNTNAFNVLLWSNYLSRFTTKPITIAIDTLLVTVINKSVYKPVIRKILTNRD